MRKVSIGLCALALATVTLNACAGPVESTWTDPVMPVATAAPTTAGVLDLSTAAPCTSDDGSGPSYPCTWDPQTQGDGRGPAFVVLVFLTPGELCPALVPNGYLCLENDPVTGP